MHGMTQGDRGGLSDRERRVLELERGWWKHAPTKDEAVREQVGMTMGEYHPFLNALLDRPEALEHDPLLVKRLRRLRNARRGAGVGRRAAR
ncbi:DUF3263 domain-containing protein [Nocardioides caldifontis]|uniref:DUF3263 domain-containing protein n=1 Tax=Nocardioides caldifontis TaxID=2588938 RepID=UPI001EF14D9F|nr:DUF3263 domain-containing protein [Nocardioides caldifontis]